MSSGEGTAILGSSLGLVKRLLCANTSTSMALRIEFQREQEMADGGEDEVDGVLKCRDDVRGGREFGTGGGSQEEVGMGIKCF